ncbi:LysR family transcriptional regulator [Rhodoligotrophos defluvii]|uniref:LysR family transcriptional regulator n=1 Tax=Rhodoligotrophos defluvii TaxID=2561934 RepID=UPI0010C9353C|nr:LysR family transcriptional regulator [Rhodoligotrophos defluvii]
MATIADLDLRLMKLFLTIVECRGFAAAQTSLNLSLSTISMHMSQLENRLGVRLCERGRDGFRLTPEGQKVYELGRRLIGTLSDVSSEIAGLRNALVGTLRIGLVDNVANNPTARLHEAIARFDSRPHEVRMDVEIVSPRDIERHVADGLLDVGIGPSLARQGSLDYEPVFEETQYLYCSYNHALFPRCPDRVTLNEVSREKYAGHICPLPDNVLLHGKLRTATTGQHMESVALLVLSGRFIGYLPGHYAREWVAGGQMRPILPDRLFYENVFYCMFRKRQSPNKIIKQFVRDLKEAHRPLALEPAAAGLV